MLKVVVFDNGWGGELVADFLENELNVVEVVRVIDWRGIPYGNNDLNKICCAMEKSLQSYIGACDVIVLGGYRVSLVLEEMRRRHPEQKFIGLRLLDKEIVRICKQKRRVVMLTGSDLIRTKQLFALRRKLARTKVELLECPVWEKMVDDNSITRDYLASYLAQRYVVTRLRTPKRTQKVQDTTSLYTRIKLEKLRQEERSDDVVAATIQRLAKVSLNVKEEEIEAMRVMPVKARRGRYQPDVVFLLNSHFWGLKPDLEAIFGWKTRVIDFRGKLLRELCATLKLPGIDGKIPKN